MKSRGRQCVARRLTLRTAWLAAAQYSRTRRPARSERHAYSSRAARLSSILPLARTWARAASRAPIAGGEGGPICFGGEAELSGVSGGVGGKGGAGGEEEDKRRRERRRKRWRGMEIDEARRRVGGDALLEEEGGGLRDVGVDGGRREEEEEVGEKYPGMVGDGGEGVGVPGVIGVEGRGWRE